MIFVGQRAIRKTEDGRAHLLQKRDGRKCVKVSIPDSCIDAEPTGVHRANRLGGVEADVDGCGGRPGRELNVIQIERTGAAIAAQLDIEAVKVRDGGYAESGKRNDVLMP